MAKICIICEKEGISGHKVKDDFVIIALRRIKQATRTAKNNELLVCRNCLDAHIKKRLSYEKKIAGYLVLAGIVFALISIFPIFTTGFSLYSFLLGLAFAAVLFILPVLTSYSPGAIGVDYADAKAKGKAGWLQLLGGKRDGGLPGQKKEDAARAKPGKAKPGKKGKKK